MSYSRNVSSKVGSPARERLSDAAATTVLLASVATMVLFLSATPAEAFRPTIPLPMLSSTLSPSTSQSRQRRMSTSSSSPTVVVVHSSVGGGNDKGGGSGGGGDGRMSNDLGDFLDPTRRNESENLKRAREFMSDTSLPISFDQADAYGDEEEDDGDGEGEMVDSSLVVLDDGKKDGSMLSSSSLVGAGARGTSASASSALFGMEGQPSSDLLARNPYLQVVSKISPSDLISKFTATADPRVQEAVRTTILGLIGSLPKLAFETTSITTGQRLASLVSGELMVGLCWWVIVATRI
jgi:hypothetical protein